jgi:hypothetical protein
MEASPQIAALVSAIDPVEVHRFGLAGRESLLLLLAASLLTFVFTRCYTRLGRRRGWRSGRIGDAHLHHMVVGIVIVLLTGMFDLSFQPGGLWRQLLAIGFGVGAAFMLDEFALTLHLRDVYWTSEGRRSIEISIVWMLLGCLLLVGISPFGIHDQSEIPRAIGFAIVAVNIVLSLVTCLKGKLTLGLLSIFLPPVGIAAAWRLARPSSLWAQLFYRRNGQKLARSRERFDPRTSRFERLRVMVTDFVAGAPTPAAGHETQY